MDDLIGIGSLVVTIIGVIAAIIVTEIRQWLRLDRHHTVSNERILFIKDISGYLFNVNGIYATTKDFDHTVPKGESALEYYGRKAWSVSSNTSITIDGETLYTKDRSPDARLKLLVGSHTGFILTRVRMHVNYREPVLPLKDLQLIGIKLPSAFGSGPLTGIDFGCIIIEPNTRAYSLTSEENDVNYGAFDIEHKFPYKIDAGDSIQINVLLEFIKSGHYEVQIIIDGINITDQTSKIQQYSSPIIHYRTIYIPSAEIELLPAILRPSLFGNESLGTLF